MTSGRRPRRAGGGPRALAISLGIVGLLLASSNGLSVTASPAQPTTSIKQFDGKISHIVFLIQENHAYDSLFGNYCLATGTYCGATADGIPNGTCVPMAPSAPSGGCVVPYNFTAAQLAPPDMPHDWNSTHAAVNNGSMNDFYAAENSKLEPFGHYNGTTAPVYWDLAEEYGLGDDFFSPAASYSLPNHWFAVAASAPNASYLVKPLVKGTPVGQLHAYLNQSNATPTLETELNHSKTTWKYYDFKLFGYNYSIQPGPNSPAYSYWNPLASKEISYKAKYRSHFVARNQFFTDAAAGKLPEISWLIPSNTQSDHPPFNLTSGQSWVASVVDALEASPDWNSTVLFVTWDEYGGFYDGVSPPILDANGDGIRVPLLAIGPWVRQGTIDHTAMDFDSVLHLIETRFHLGCLGPRDCNAALPLGMFSFSGGPRAPIYIPPYANASYPMPLQSSGLLPYYSPLQPPVPPPAPDAGDATVLDWG